MTYFKPFPFSHKTTLISNSPCGTIERMIEEKMTTKHTPTLDIKYVGM